jgi:hypothetical protein
MVGEKLLEYGVARLVGLDISETAYKALVKLTAVFSSH